MRGLSVLFVAFCGTSCIVPPSCLDRTFGSPAPDGEHLATLTLFAEPRAERGVSITLRTGGRMTVSALDMWPESCPRVAREDLAALSRSWQPVLAAAVTPRTEVRALANPRAFDGGPHAHPHAPLLSLSFGPPSGRSLQLLWDGRSTLPEDLDTAVIETLEMACSNSRRARRSLLRDLPPQVARRLDCQGKEPDP